MKDPAPMTLDSRETQSRGSFHRIVPHHGRTHLDLFSGIGGFALAAQTAGFTTIGFSEIEPYACKILKRHWPTVPNYGDIRNVRGLSADLITGGFPCQPYSQAGKRGGASDDRALWPEMFRVIGETRPAWVLGENVPGIISMELDRVLSDLESLGYAAWPLGIPACAVDARHRRQRIWIVAYSEHERRNASALNRKPSRDDRRQAQSEEQAEQPPGNNPLANGNGARLEKWKEQPARQEFQAAFGNGLSVSDDGRGRSEGTRTSIVGQPQPARWQPEPGMGRVANGIPNRIHRLRGLGNAIVPQVAAEILKTLVMGNAELTHGENKT